MIRKIVSWLPLAALLMILTTGFPFHIFAQGTAGYTKIGSVTYGTNSYTDATPVSGQVTNYEVTSDCATTTSTCAAGESAPSNIVTATTPAGSGSHSNTLTWAPPTTGGTPQTYNIYSLVVASPNPPTQLAVTSK